ncbi:hypothetical protein HKX54_09250 [Sulfitobacter sp. M57]|uniref:hypothetical protein n=1 Tax=unclassified Sulfitobacter TaxID=196795 RepID=UPI0023E0FD83|nr:MULTISPECIES: hypothetical protein [unclassified Sulfitobacter]MDF3414636.1 hypothetical protein [Sulfitobacter sp. KE5]MDF3422118.1 hypothetical protein [Sulfitobacter sp. KE43]MDF3433183.1 hypothetical protein [Sulfitobacter sp. KE42]MDF3458823.1 hypothetical protein [Sulfitobacter sp. S74]MDF3462722.1 hypothetical protein [Sulfitobacter sp. Ks18]
MRLKAIDAIEQRIATAVSEKGLPMEQALAEVCWQDGDLCVDVVMLAAVSVIIRLDDFAGFNAENTIAASLARHRVFAAFAADVALISGKPRNCRSLQEVWRETGDRMFAPSQG